MGPLEPTMGVSWMRLVRMGWSRVAGVESPVARAEAKPTVACLVESPGDGSPGRHAGPPSVWAERNGRCSCLDYKQQLRARACTRRLSGAGCWLYRSL
jgi:hypothetical protein